MADITLTSGSDPADFKAANGASVTIKNSVTNADGTAAGTTLSCDSGLFTPANEYPKAMTAGEEITVRIGTSGKDYYYTDPSKPGQGTRTGRINP